MHKRVTIIIISRQSSNG